MTSTYLKMEDYPPIVSQLSKIFTIMSHPIFSKCCGVTIISLPIDFGWLVVCLGSMPRLFSLALDKYRLVFYLISFWSKLWDISPCAQKNALGLLDLLNTSYGPIKTNSNRNEFKGAPKFYIGGGYKHMLSVLKYPTLGKC